MNRFLFCLILVMIVSSCSKPECEDFHSENGDDCIAWSAAWVGDWVITSHTTVPQSIGDTLLIRPTSSPDSISINDTDYIGGIQNERYLRIERFDYVSTAILHGSRIDFEYEHPFTSGSYSVQKLD